ncbi:MAG TPA: surface-adhesin E family protein [Burkholderiales bacterium]|jgi:hypothetical protein|nr:surface-adhesin E family protein [Burkholderiales bacterium]
MRLPTMLALLAFAALAHAENWVEVGADTEARFYVDIDSIEVDRETVRFLKRGVYTHTLTENFGGHKTSFKETVGTVEIDCGRRINRVVQIDMIGDNGEVVWSSGRMRQRTWEEVRPNSHGEATLDYVCRRTGS